MADTRPGKVVVADIRGCAALNRRAVLRDLLYREADVEVSNPHGGMWRGKIIGIADHPVIHLELHTGKRVCLPQAYGVVELTGSEPVISDALLRQVQDVRRRLHKVADLTDRPTNEFLLGDVADQLHLLEQMLAAERPQ